MLDDDRKSRRATDRGRARPGGRCGALLSLVALAAVVLAGCQTTGGRTSAKRSAEPIRAVWVTRWDYKTPSDIAKVMRNCRHAGFNTILFQVRGDGTAMYRSKLEPWSEDLGGKDPGFDPLRVACKEAHRRGLELHAWANVVPGWRGKRPPSNPRQLYNARPEWFWRDASGRRQPLGWYSSVNPCYPEVRRYLVDVMTEIVRGYPVDGLHMDYIRFPNESSPAYPTGTRVPDYPRDPRTLALFRQATGKTPDADRRAWDAWRTAQVTQLVRDIRTAVKREKPHVVLSAAVGASPKRALRAYFQDTRTWLAENLLDVVFPMNYAKSVRVFEQVVGQWDRMRLRVPVAMGVMFDKQPPGEVNAKLSGTARTGSHFAAFAYNSLFERLDARGRPAHDEQSASRAALRRTVIPHLRRLAAAQGRYAAR